MKKPKHVISIIALTAILGLVLAFNVRDLGPYYCTTVYGASATQLGYTETLNGTVLYCRTQLTNKATVLKNVLLISD